MGLNVPGPQPDLPFDIIQVYPAPPEAEGLPDLPYGGASWQQPSSLGNLADLATPLPDQYPDYPERPVPTGDALPTERPALLVKDILNLQHGTEIPIEVWGPLFGGEAMNTEIYSKLLLNPDDEILLTGSAVTKMFFGGYLYDIVSNTVPTDVRSDTDIKVWGQTMQERMQAQIETSESTWKKSLYGAKANVAGVNVDIVSTENLYSASITALEEFGSFLLDHYEGENKQKLIERNEQELAKIRVLAEDRDGIITMTAFQRHEAISARLVRDDKGKLRMFVHDPNNFLQSGEIAPSAALQQLTQGLRDNTYVGYVLPPNPNSLDVYLQEMAQYCSGVEFTSKATYGAINSILRMVRSVAELDIEMPFFRETPFFPVYQNMYELMSRIARKEPVFFFTEIFKRYSKPETTDFFEHMRYKAQETFARACFSDLVTTAHYMLGYLPIAALIADSLGAEFDIMHSEQTRHLLEGMIPLENMLFVSMIRAGITADNLESFLSVQDGQGVDLLRSSAMRSMFRLNELYEKLIGFRTEIVYDADTKTPSMRSFEPLRPPSSMSEVFALLLISLEWDPDSKGDEIDSIVADWKLEGEQTLCWKRQADRTFELGISADEIISWMRLYKLQLEHSTVTAA